MMRLAAALAVAVATPAHATNGMRMIGFGPVQNSMGGVGVGATLDACSLLSNPAGIADLGQRLDAGGAFFKPTVKYSATGIAASWVISRDANTQISCQVCHDPHKAATIKAGGVIDAGLRDVSVDSLRNGFKYQPAGASQVCSYCHSSRYNVKTRVTTTGPYYGWVTRFGPHENPQMDMLVGGNGYEYGDPTVSGLNTHGGLEDGCVTCHMQGRTRSNNTLANHSMHMTGDTAYGFKPVTACKSCHGEIEDYNDIKAFYDYDRNGKIEGVQTEIQGLLNALKAKLPKDASGNVIGEGSVKAADSAAVMNRLGAYPGLYVAGNAYRGVSVGSIVEDADKVAAWVLHRAV